MGCLPKAAAKPRVCCQSGAVIQRKIYVCKGLIDGKCQCHGNLTKRQSALFGPSVEQGLGLALRLLCGGFSGKALPIYGDGMNVRDWLHVEDHCRGIEACLARGVSGETYNIGGGAELPNMTVIDTICAEVDRCLLYTSPSPRDS